MYTFPSPFPQICRMRSLCTWEPFFFHFDLHKMKFSLIFMWLDHFSVKSCQQQQQAFEMNVDTCMRASVRGCVAFGCRVWSLWVSSSSSLFNCLPQSLISSGHFVAAAAVKLLMAGAPICYTTTVHQSHTPRQPCRLATFTLREKEHLSTNPLSVCQLSPSQIKGSSVFPGCHCCKESSVFVS